MNGKLHRIVVAGLFALSLAGTTTADASGGAQAVVTPKADVKWAATNIPAVSTAAVQGEMAAGASHFFLKYAAGFVTPAHHHSADHYVTTISGNLVVVADGKEQKLPPGSYFAFTGKAPHVARCEGAEECVMFVDARGAWDIVPEASEKPKPKM